MRREDLVLAALSVARGDFHSPVQIQKLFFLIDREIYDLVDGPHFNFQPYNYGPFDKDVYNVLDSLMAKGFVLVIGGNWRSYKLTGDGQEIGEKAFDSLKNEAKDYIIKASEFVRRLGFTDLVKSIYKAYPEMKENSVFQN